MPYCIYTDKDVPENDGNHDHVVPLSLGGHDDFQVWADRKYNSAVGSSVDGKLANEFLVMLARREADARGHTKKPIVPIWKNTELDGHPIQLRLEKEKIEGFDPRTHAVIAEDELVDKILQSRFKIDRFAAIRFVAKVALGGGYFVYGEPLKKIIDCEELRKLVTLDPDIARQDASFRNMKTKICDRFHPDATGSSVEGAKYRFLCEFSRQSAFIAVPHDDAVSFHIGVLGMYMGSVICLAKPHTLPNEGEHDLGHVILTSPNSIERLSLRELAKRAHAVLAAAKAGAGEPPAEPVSDTQDHDLGED